MITPTFKGIWKIKPLVGQSSAQLKFRFYSTHRKMGKMEVLGRAYGSLCHIVFWICFSDCSLSLESVSFYGVFGQGPFHLIDDAQMVTVHC